MRERNYRQNCSVARASDLLGERWTFLIIRDLLIASRRFAELERRMKGMGTNLLAKRLRELRAAGLITEGPNYALTAMGRELEPVVLALARWSLKWQGNEATPYGTHYPDWDLLALKALFVPDPSRNGVTVARFVHDGWSGWVQVEAEHCIFGLGETDKADVTILAPIATVAERDRLISRLPSEERTAAHRFLDAFRL